MLLKKLEKNRFNRFQTSLAAICVIFGAIVIVFEEVPAIAVGIFLIIQGKLLQTRLHGS
jgi:hypothetical protein